jgi:hypothetical protein
MKPKLSENRMKWEWLRWQILWVFAIGYSLSRSTFSEHDFQYLAFTLLALFSCAFLLTSLNRFENSTVAAWTVLGLFVMVYYVKFYWIVLDPLPIQIMLPPAAESSFTSVSALFSGFVTSTIGFAVFCVSTGLLLFFRGREHSPVLELSPAAHRRVARALLLVLPLLMLGLGYVTYVYDVGFLGIESDPLPFRLRGVIFYSRLILIPALVLLLIYCSGKCGHLLKARIGLLLLLMEGVSDTFLRSSRASLLMPLLTLGFLVAVGGYKLKSVERRIGFAAVVVAFLSIPLITEYRALRLSGQGLGAFFSADTGTGTWEMLLAGMQFVLFRIPGIEAIVSMKGLGAEPLGMHALAVISRPRGIAGYLTGDVYGFDPNGASTFSPSFVGWLYLAAGIVAVISGAIVLSLLVTTGWQYLSRSRLYSCRVAQTLTLLLLFHALTEGDFESTVLQLTVSIGVVFTLEFLLRAFNYPVHLAPPSLSGPTCTYVTPE